MQVQWCGYYEVVGTLKLYLMQKNLFKLFALTGSGDAKTLAALKPPSETFITFTTPQQSCRAPPPSNIWWWPLITRTVCKRAVRVLLEYFLVFLNISCVLNIWLAL